MLFQNPDSPGSDPDEVDVGSEANDGKTPTTFTSTQLKYENFFLQKKKNQFNYHNASFQKASNSFKICTLVKVILQNNQKNPEIFSQIPTVIANALAEVGETLRLV